MCFGLPLVPKVAGVMAVELRTGYVRVRLKDTKGFRGLGVRVLSLGV